MRSDSNWARIKKILDCIVSNLSQGAVSKIFDFGETPGDCWEVQTRFSKIRYSQRSPPIEQSIVEGSLNPRLILILLAEKQSHLIPHSMISTLFEQQPCVRDRQKLFSPIAAEWMSVCLSKRRLELFLLPTMTMILALYINLNKISLSPSRHTDFEGKNLMFFDVFKSSLDFFPQISQSVISSAPTNQRRDVKRDSRWVSSANKTWWCLNDFFSRHSLHGNRSTADYVSETRRTYRFALINRRQKTPNGRE